MITFLDYALRPYATEIVYVEVVLGGSWRLKMLRSNYVRCFQLCDKNELCDEMRHDVSFFYCEEVDIILWKEGQWVN